MKLFKRLIVFVTVGILLACIANIPKLVSAFQNNNTSISDITATPNVTSKLTQKSSSKITPNITPPPTAKPVVTNQVTVKPTDEVTPTPNNNTVAPPKSGSKYVVFLSPSMQSTNVGYGDYGTEKNRMNLIADVVETELSNHGIDVRRNTGSRSAQRSSELGIAANPDVYLSIHSNAANSQMRGVEIWTQTNSVRSNAFCNKILDSYTKTYPGPKIGVQHCVQSDWPILECENAYNNNIPMGLIEIAFHDNATDANWVINNTQEIGVALAKGILDYLNITY